MDVDSFKFLATMEYNLATVYDRGFKKMEEKEAAIRENGRPRRAVTVDRVTVQVKQKHL